MPRDAIKIRPRYKDPRQGYPTKVEILEGMKDNPEFAKLDDRHWAAIYATWDIVAAGQKPTIKEVARRAGVHRSTISEWRCREDFLRASEMVQRVLLWDWAPLLVHRSLELAAQGDKKLMMFWLERMVPVVDKKKEPTNEFNFDLTWTTPEPNSALPDHLEAEEVEEPEDEPIEETEVE